MTGVDDELVSPRRRLLVLVRRRPSAVPPTTSFRDRELAEQAEAAAKLRARKQRAGYDAEAGQLHWLTTNGASDHCVCSAAIMVALSV